MRFDSELYNDICDRVYEEMCSRCPRAIICHEDCVECEEFGDTVQAECDKVGIVGYWD